MRTLITAITMTIALTLVTGIVYPIAVWGIAQVLFPWQANGSLVDARRTGGGLRTYRTEFRRAEIFPSAVLRPPATRATTRATPAAPTWGRPIARLIDATKAALHKVLEENPGASPAQVPIDLVTASGSGLDPEISPASAELQVARVAKARGLSEDVVRRRGARQRAAALRRTVRGAGRQCPRA